MRILFADDNHEICELYQLVFGLNSIVATIAHNGEEAVAAVKDEPKGFDVIVLDIGMPQMDGWGAFKAIRQLPEGQNVPIVVLTGYAITEHRARASEFGAAVFLNKPVFPHDLLRILRDIVEKRHQSVTGKEKAEPSEDNPTVHED